MSRGSKNGRTSTTTSTGYCMPLIGRTEPTAERTNKRRRTKSPGSVARAGSGNCLDIPQRSSSSGVRARQRRVIPRTSARQTSLKECNEHGTPYIVPAPWRASRSRQAGWFIMVDQTGQFMPPLWNMSLTHAKLEKGCVYIQCADGGTIEATRGSNTVHG